MESGPSIMRQNTTASGGADVRLDIRLPPWQYIKCKLGLLPIRRLAVAEFRKRAQNRATGLTSDYPSLNSAPLRSVVGGSGAGAGTRSRKSFLASGGKDDDRRGAEADGDGAGGEASEGDGITEAFTGEEGAEGIRVSVDWDTFMPSAPNKLFLAVCVLLVLGYGVTMLIMIFVRRNAGLGRTSGIATRAAVTTTAMLAGILNQTLLHQQEEALLMTTAAATTLTDRFATMSQRYEFIMEREALAAASLLGTLQTELMEQGALSRGTLEIAQGIHTAVLSQQQQQVTSAQGGSTSAAINAETVDAVWQRWSFRCATLLRAASFKPQIAVIEVGSSTASLNHSTTTTAAPAPIGGGESLPFRVIRGLPTDAPAAFVTTGVFSSNATAGNGGITSTGDPFYTPSQYLQSECFGVLRQWALRYNSSSPSMSPPNATVRKSGLRVNLTAWSRDSFSTAAPSFVSEPFWDGWYRSGGYDAFQPTTTTSNNNNNNSNTNRSRWGINSHHGAYAIAMYHPSIRTAVCFFLPGPEASALEFNIVLDYFARTESRKTEIYQKSIGMEKSHNSRFATNRWLVQLMAPTWAVENGELSVSSSSSGSRGTSAAEDGWGICGKVRSVFGAHSGVPATLHPANRNTTARARGSCPYGTLHDGTPHGLPRCVHRGFSSWVLDAAREYSYGRTSRDVAREVLFVRNVDGLIVIGAIAPMQSTVNAMANAWKQQATSLPPYRSATSTSASTTTTASCTSVQILVYVYDAAILASDFQDRWIQSFKPLNPSVALSSDDVIAADSPEPAWYVLAKEQYQVRGSFGVASVSSSSATFASSEKRANNQWVPVVVPPNNKCLTEINGVRGTFNKNIYHDQNVTGGTDICSEDAWLTYLLSTLNLEGEPGTGMGIAPGPEGSPAVTAFSHAHIRFPMRSSAAVVDEMDNSKTDSVSILWETSTTTTSSTPTGPTNTTTAAAAVSSATTTSTTPYGVMPYVKDIIVLLQYDLHELRSLLLKRFDERFLEFNTRIRKVLPVYPMSVTLFHDDLHLRVSPSTVCPLSETCLVYTDADASATGTVRISAGGITPDPAAPIVFRTDCLHCVANTVIGNAEKNSDIVRRQWNDAGRRLSNGTTTKKNFEALTIQALRASTDSDGLSTQGAMDMVTSTVDLFRFDVTNTLNVQRTSGGSTYSSSINGASVPTTVVTTAGLTTGMTPVIERVDIVRGGMIGSVVGFPQFAFAVLISRNSATSTPILQVEGIKSFFISASCVVVGALLLRLVIAHTFNHPSDQWSMHEGIQKKEEGVLQGVHRGLLPGYITAKLNPDDGHDEDLETIAVSVARPFVSESIPALVVGVLDIPRFTEVSVAWSPLCITRFIAYYRLLAEEVSKRCGVQWFSGIADSIAVHSGVSGPPSCSGVVSFCCLVMSLMGPMYAHNPKRLPELQKLFGEDVDRLIFGPEFDGLMDEMAKEEQRRHHHRDRRVRRRQAASEKEKNRSTSSDPHHNNNNNVTTMISGASGGSSQRRIRTSELESRQMKPWEIGMKYGGTSLTPRKADGQGGPVGRTGSSSSSSSSSSSDSDDSTSGVHSSVESPLQSTRNSRQQQSDQHASSGAATRHFLDRRNPKSLNAFRGLMPKAGVYMGQGTLGAVSGAPSPMPSLASLRPVTSAVLATAKEVLEHPPLFAPPWYDVFSGCFAVANRLQSTAKATGMIHVGASVRDSILAECPGPRNAGAATKILTMSLSALNGTGSGATTGGSAAQGQGQGSGLTNEPVQLFTFSDPIKTVIKMGVMITSYTVESAFVPVPDDLLTDLCIEHVSPEYVDVGTFSGGGGLLGGGGVGAKSTKRLKPGGTDSSNGSAAGGKATANRGAGAAASEDELTSDGPSMDGAKGDSSGEVIAP